LFSIIHYADQITNSDVNKLLFACFNLYIWYNLSYIPIIHIYYKTVTLRDKNRRSVVKKYSKCMYLLLFLMFLIQYMVEIFEKVWSVWWMESILATLRHLLWTLQLL